MQVPQHLGVQQAARHPASYAAGLLQSQAKQQLQAHMQQQARVGSTVAAAGVPGQSVLLDGQVPLVSCYCVSILHVLQHQV